MVKAFRALRAPFSMSSMLGYDKTVWTAAWKTTRATLTIKSVVMSVLA